jgi:hypothetical protein
MARRDESDEYEFDDDLDAEFGDEEAEEADDDDAEEEDFADTEEPEAEEPEPPPPPPPDDPEVVGTLESFNARLDVNENGNVWRVILYEKGGTDEALDWVKKLPAVRELWVIHTKVTPDAIEELKREMPDLVIYK